MVPHLVVCGRLLPVCILVASVHRHGDSTNVYIFDGFPQLSVSSAICLDDDVRNELVEVLIEPSRITVKSKIGSGQS